MTNKQLPNTSSSCTEDKTSVSVSDLESLTYQCSAAGRLRRECLVQADGGIRQSTYQILTKSLNKKLSNLELLGDNSRSSVIQLTPRTHTTSTPSNSPPLPEVPRQCQSACIQLADRHTSACSEISSIGANDVFDPPEDLILLNVPDITCALSNQISHPVDTMEAAEKSLKSKVRKFNIKLRGYTVGQLSSGTIAWHKSYIDEVRGVYEDLLESIDIFIEDFTSDITEEKVSYWTNQSAGVTVGFQNYVASFSSKLDNLQAAQQSTAPTLVSNPSLEHFQTQRLQLLKEQNEIAQGRATAAANETLREVEARKNIAIKKAESKRDAILQLIDDLNERMGTVEDWKEETDLAVSRALRNLSSWRKELVKITDMFQDFTELYSSNNLSEEEVEMASTKLMVDKIVQEIRDTGKALEEEDLVRELYTLDITVTDKVKLPTFEGKDEEDYARFKVEVEKAFINNRVTKSDKLLKLRDCLKGHARKLIPDSLTQDIDEAWAVLDKAYGDPVRLIKSKTEALSRMEPLPRENNKKGIKGQVEWYIELESLLQNLLVHGRSSQKLGMIVFQPLFINDVYNLFPSAIANKLIKCEGEADEHFKNVLDKISQLRAETQKLQIARESKKPSNELKKEDSKKQGYFGQGKFTKGVKLKDHNMQDPSSLVTYNPPIRDEKCRICNTLEAHGDTKQLYDSHVSNYPTGCPRYVSMSVNRRYQTALEAKLCLACHHPDYIYRKNDKTHKCSVLNSKRKGRYTCQSSNCFVHLWVCTRHKNTNMKMLEKFEEELKTKYDLDFGFVVNIPVLAAPIKSNKRKASVLESVTATINSVPDEDKLEKLSSPKCITMKSNLNEVSNEEYIQESATACNQKRRKTLSTDQAIVKLKNKLTAEGIKDTLQPIANGTPQFMIGYSKGKTRGLMTLYDTGCSSVLFREGVPQNELHGSVLKTKGPFKVNGVGDTSVTVNDEYLCAMELVDNRRQIMEGWTVNKITATLPLVNSSLAETEIKASLNNSELRQLNCYPQAGGDCDVLLGIMYLSVFPEPIHSLSNGLTIYKLRLKSHDTKYNAVIGGPCENFHRMSQEFGGIGIMFANLTEQLATYQEFGPPKIVRNLMSKEDVDFAQKYNEWGIEEFQKPIEEFKNVANYEFMDEPDAVFKVLECSDCGTELSPEAAASLGLVANVTEMNCDEENSALKNLQKAVNEGLSIDYRCPKCRNCHDCRRSFQTERVSLREEAEDMLIWDSVFIDWQNKQIICHLPLRGNEEEFLSDNRDMALKVLDQQCYKYRNDTDTKESIVKAFEKLIKNQQMILWKDLTAEQQKLIESKAVNHYIIWRVVFKSSLSTPARPVFDGSQRTRHRANNTGGRCLNDLTVKGRVVTLNLVKMVLRFQTGKVACQGDLKQFYASIKLVEDQWNLQRVLFKDNLDPEAEPIEAIIRTLIWGIKSVSAQSEAAIIKLADCVRDKQPLLADFLTNSRFVDDLGDSAENLDILQKLITQADDLFSQVGLGCKGWSLSGTSPPSEVCEEGDMVSIGGMKWFSKLDMLEVPVPALHFSKKVRGRISVGTEVFTGSLKTWKISFLRSLQEP